MTHTFERKHDRDFDPEWQKKFSQWFKKHKMVITIVSALTVLTSFVVKEALDEPAKDLLSAIAAAKSDNNQEQGGMYNQLTDINSNLKIVTDKLIENKRLDDTEVQLEKLRADHTKILELIGENIGHLIALKAVLPPSFAEKESNFEENYRALGFPGGDASVGMLTKSENDWQRLYDQSRLLRGEGVKELMKLDERTELRHHVYAWIAYVSFALGWIVGLFPNLIGGKATSGAE
jgi:hypothetical protein